MTGQGFAGRLVLHDCDAVKGDSGSPLLIERKDGAYGLVAIHVATLARADGPRVAAALAAKVIQE